jgi:hypothetical protein
MDSGGIQIKRGCGNRNLGTAKTMLDIAMWASSGCEPRTMLCAMAKEFDRLGELAELKLGSWLHLDSISLAPTELLFLVQSPIIEHYFLRMHIDVQGEQNCKIQ